jgi:GMC oxidoreductase
MAERYDIAIIGTGAGGGTLAWALAPTGKKILLLERGEYVPREQANWSTRAVNAEGRYQTGEVWRDADGKPLHPHTNYWVGGNTKFYGAALFRMRREDFGELKHWGGISPAWPIEYDDLEPYYTAAERLYRVHGERGIDPTDPPASAPYPHPAVSHEPRIQALADDLARQGLHPFHVPLGVMLDEASPRTSACIRCATCDGHPCLVGAKSDAQVVAVDPALRHPNVTLLTGAYVSKLGTDAGGRAVTRIVVERGGAREEYAADVVVVAAGAINSAALLLRSASDRHPGGLANSSGVVGRHYMGHVNSVLMALSKCPNPTVFQKTLGVNDFYFGAEDWPYPVAAAPARCGRRLRPSSAHLARAAQPRARRIGVPRAVRGRPGGARRRLPPGHRVELAPGALRARPLPRPRRPRGRPRLPRPAGPPSRRSWRGERRGDLRGRSALPSRRLYRAGVGSGRDAAGLAGPRPGARTVRARPRVIAGRTCGGRPRRAGHGQRRAASGEGAGR